MIPAADIRPRLHLPVVTLALVAALIAAAVAQFLWGRGLWVPRYSFSAALLGQEPASELLRAAAVSPLLHVSWPQLVGDVVYLYVFGTHLEDRFGRLRYLAFLFGGLLASDAAQLVFAAGSPVWVLGLSGVLTALLGAYAGLWPTQRILTVFPVLFFLTFIEVPALVFVFVFGAQQLLYPYLPIHELPFVVPWPALFGGLIYGLSIGLGLSLAKLLRRRPPRPRLSSLPGRAPLSEDEDG